MTAYHWNTCFRYVHALIFGYEGVSSHYVKSGHTEESLLVVNSFVLQNLSENRHS